MIRAYIDDSGKAGDSSVTVLAGYQASADRWAAFSDEWQDALLNEGQGLPYFRMVEAWRLTGPYHKLGFVRRNALIAKLLAIIEKYVEYAFIVVLPIKEHNLFFRLKDDQSKQYNRPYFFQFYVLLSAIYDHAFKYNYNDRVEVVFDEQGGESKAKILGCMEDFSLMAASSLPDLVIPTPTFQSDKEVLPLQAADMLAWLCRRNGDLMYKRKKLKGLAETALLEIALKVPHRQEIWDRERLAPLFLEFCRRAEALEEANRLSRDLNRLVS